ncbi:MAG: SIMPL domain-containing protein [Candidatus Micrarchaeaceae archaeon]
MKDDSKILCTAVCGIIVVAALAIIGVAWVGPELSAQQSGSTISVYSTGASYGLPSQALVYLTVNGTGNTTQLATENLSATLLSLNSTLSKFINDNWTLVSTQSYSVYKIYNKSGYEATESVYVTLPNINNSSAFLGATSAIPNVYVTGIQSMLSEWQVSMLRTSALQYAMANATSIARTLAGSGMSVTPGNITVSGFNVYPYGTNNFNSAAAASTVISNPAFYTGRSKVVEAITVQFRYG